MKKSIETTIGVTNVKGFSAVGRSKWPSENVEDAHVPWEIIPDTMVVTGVSQLQTIFAELPSPDIS